MLFRPSYNRKFSLGTTKRIFSRLWNPFILAATLLLASGYLLAADGNSVPAQSRYRVFALKHISVEQAKKLLAEAKLGTVSQLPTDNMILVTAQTRQLIKASAILKLVDTKTPFVMKKILPASAVANLPLNEQIAAKVGNISIGSFSNPPSDAGKTKAIIDVHDDAVVAIAPADQLEKIIGTIEGYTSSGTIKQLTETKAEVLQPDQPAVTFTELTLTPGKKPTEANQKEELKTDTIEKAELERVKAELQKVKVELNHRNGSSKTQQAGANANKSEPNELFDRLLDSLSEAEKKVAELAKPAPNEPDEPTIQPVAPVTPTEKSEPNKPSIDLKQPEEKAPEAVKSPVEPNLVTIPKKSATEKITTKPKPEPEKVAEQVTAKVEEPNQVAPVLQEEPNKVTQVVEPNTVKRAYQPEIITNGNETLELDLPDKLEIIDLLDLVGKYLNLNYMYDEKDLKGQVVNLRVQGPIKVKDLYPLAESVLKQRGLVMSRNLDLVIIAPQARAWDLDPRIVDPEKRSLQAGDVIITSIFRLKHIDTASAQNLLTGMKLGVNFSSIAEAKILIVTGYAYRMERIGRLLDMIDKPGEKKKFRSRALKFTTAKTLAAKVKTLAEQLGTITISIAAPTPTAPTRPTTPGRRPIPTRPPTTRPTTPTAPPAKEGVYLDADERTNRILMIGLEEQLAIVDSLIDSLDVEQQVLRTLRLYEIQHVDAEEVRTKLSELGIVSGGGLGTAASRTATRTPTRPPTSPTSRTPTRPTTLTTTTAIAEPLVEEPQVVIIEPTNSLLVNATAEQHVQIAMIIGFVDAEQEVGQNPYVIYPLENQDPEELAGVLEKLISETITEKSGTGADSKVLRTTTKRKIEEDIFIVPDTKSYSLIIYASKKNQQWISSLIKELDAYRPQVLLDVTLVEITKNENFDLDLDAILYSGLPKLDFSSLPGVLGETSVNAFYKDEDVDLILSALQKKGYGRVLARPKLLVNDNEEGTIKTETQTTIVSPKTQVVPGSGVTASTAAVSVDLQTYTSGITLTITPHIHQGDHLQLIVNINRVDFDDKLPYSITLPATAQNQPPQTLSGPTPPDLLTSDVTSTVTVPDNSTIILGGLERLKQTKEGTKVPFLGDIPLIGGIFRTTSNEDNQSRLYVFVKANIIRPGEEDIGVSNIRAVSLKNRQKFEKYEKEMQEYEDWPGIKPTPMDPVQVLEPDEDEVALQKGRQVSVRSRKEMLKSRDLPATKPETVHPMRILETN